ncbi:type II toxin-antitoxin system YafQ family toxin [uncultured Bacteroides sp.]|uniref:type II toxin-antitoxin system YafQ family toxin n=1 Tax=uncultured Bacteroides sp. TaxID=162156 RepID=UPI0033903B8D
MRCQKRELNLLLLQRLLKFYKKREAYLQNTNLIFCPGNLRDAGGECHVKPDGLLIWEQDDKELTLLLLNTGTHSDLF